MCATLSMWLCSAGGAAAPAELSREGLLQLLRTSQQGMTAPAMLAHLKVPAAHQARWAHSRCAFAFAASRILFWELPGLGLTFRGRCLLSTLLDIGEVHRRSGGACLQAETSAATDDQ